MSTKTKQTQSLSIIGQDVPNTLESIKAKLNELKLITDTPYKTTGVLTGLGDIKTMKDSESLIKAYASVKAKEKAYNDAADELGIKSYKQFSIDGATSEQWKSDINLRINIITVEDRKNKLQTAYDKAAKFLSEEDQRAIAMKEIAALLEE